VQGLPFREPAYLFSCIEKFPLINFVNKNGDPLVSKQMGIGADLGEYVQPG